MRAAPAVVFATKAELAGAVAQWMRDPIAAMARYGHISDWDTRLITDMEGIFCGDSTAASKDFDATWCAEANKRFDEDISRWNTAAVKTMRGMFYDAKSFDQDVSGWDMRAVADTSYMFHGASAFSWDLSSWDIRGVTDMKCA